MEWTSKTPPIHVWPDDIWIREPGYSRWAPDMSKQEWHLIEEGFVKDGVTKPIPFPKNVQVHE